ncbi:MAG TPA: hypothetical protein VFL65_03295 [Jatrophihabitans sp.]|nr:hypothetical protein [Jatrophihabitans sp.]
MTTQELPRVLAPQWPPAAPPADHRRWWRAAVVAVASAVLVAAGAGIGMAAVAGPSGPGMTMSATP